MTIEIRPPAEDELRAVMEAAEAAFGEEVEDDAWERERKILPASRALGAFDGGRPVGLAAAYAFDLSIPGGELPCAGVTWVGVLPSHRRRGILRDFMRRQLDDVRGWGEPIAALWASEASIYGRFGYGPAAPGVAAKSNPARFALKEAQESTAAVRLTDAEEAAGLFPPIYDTVRSRRARDAVALGDLVEGATARGPEGAGAAGRVRSSTPSPSSTEPPRATRCTGSRASGRRASRAVRSA